MSDAELFEATRQFWDDAAATFDNEPDHGLRDPHVQEAWRALLAQWLPSATQTPQASPKKILDIGSGTGSLSLLLAAWGHDVTGIDLSPAMIAHAQAKAVAAGAPIHFQVMNAAHPHFPQQHFDIVLCRHLLWLFPEPAQILQRWVSLLAPGGRLILIEGFWLTGAGLHTQETLDALPSCMTQFDVQNLSGNVALWGSEVSDERYAVVADKNE